MYELSGLHCFSCGRETWLDGFTLSEFDPSKLLAAALVDQARKHRKRSPEEVQRIEEQRRNAPDGERGSRTRDERRLG
jgi:hypothetical protein